ncbi:Nif3-like dinuclear metal center hexameric protein [Ornithinibacillus sp. L9]|uniref:GTP cyclohydrolase 1 type 2 homolog n=1 Tax=Ornithinibacillus caprae TaxID=2678566 RepID=A0A6N8FEJ5_9BACI|nr:Nif3-like dinuclear metal center hexameric protein [Ornithinibacillus caprae]MUK87106.1 Nif3-like dinuclear metal center hexameric protein [Ornithinibacillus caprae]
MKKPLTNSDVFKVMEEWAPKSLAYDWDNVGLQVGSHNKTVKKIMITLDVMEEVVDEAIQQNVDLIIAHHPLLFKPLHQVNTDSPHGRIVKKLIENEITVYASHTNLDAAVGGVNDMLSDQLNLTQREVLADTYHESLYKIAIYVPVSHKADVLEALSNQGAGHIGNYSHCSFQTEGTGTFKPLEGSTPYIGSEDEIENVHEVKIETIVEESKLHDVVRAMITSHPYEEPAYDIYPLQNEGKSFGIGRIGELKEHMNLEAFCGRLKRSMGVSHVRATGDLSKKVKKVAVLGGSGEKYIHMAKRKGADVYVTGDMTFHMAQEAWQMGLAVVDAGHYIESIMKTGTKKHLENKLKEIEIITSTVDTDPFKFV